jgi:hypothetical protein
VGYAARSFTRLQELGSPLDRPAVLLLQMLEMCCTLGA